MFTVHDIVDIAIRVERNGERAYREAAARARDEELSRLLLWLAEQEAEHAEWLSGLLAEVGDAEVDEDLASMGRSMLVGVVGDGAFSLDDKDLAGTSLVEALDAAVELEADTVVFYGMLAGFVTDPDASRRLAEVIEEEQRHGRYLSGFLDDGRLPGLEELAAP